MSQERQYPSRCPNCHQLLADAAERHCGKKSSPHCPWMRCKCGTNIAQTA